jgi:hypothetical protein
VFRLAVWKVRTGRSHATTSLRASPDFASYSRTRTVTSNAETLAGLVVVAIACETIRLRTARRTLPSLALVTVVRREFNFITQPLSCHDS